MKKLNRLLKTWDFQNVIKNKKRVINESFALYFFKNDIHTRIGISVSKKIGNAVKRNKFKRQVKTMCNQLFDYKNKIDIVIILQKDFTKKNYDENFKLLTKLKEKAGI